MDNAENIAPNDLAASHGELHHYTNVDGLRGIVQSNTVWASHFAKMNDETEVVLLWNSLIEAFSHRFFLTLREIRNDGTFKLRKQLEQAGGIKRIADDFANSYILDSFSDIFLGSPSKARPPIFEPYIASFCSHANDRAYERENGLLSQWRGYAGLGGYCIVFDTKAFSDLLKKERSRDCWQNIRIAPANYFIEAMPLEAAFPNSLDSWDSALLNHLSGQRIFTSMESIYELVWFLTFAKHQGFIEEREIRIVAIPKSKQGPYYPEDDLNTLIYPTDSSPAEKTILTRPSSKGERRHVVLFEGLNVTLPIKRVIVGPSADRKKSFAVAREILGPRTPLVFSVTPFVG
jgi:hypothetical protein